MNKYLFDCNYQTDNSFAYKIDAKLNVDLKIIDFVPSINNVCLRCDQTTTNILCKCKSVYFCSEECKSIASILHDKHCNRDLFTICASCGKVDPEAKCDKCFMKFCDESCKECCTHTLADCNHFASMNKSNDIKKENNNECQICNENIIYNYYLYKTSCGHIFCAKCLFLWSKSSKKMVNNEYVYECPMCRSILKFSSIDNHNKTNIVAHIDKDLTEFLKHKNVKILYDNIILYIDTNINNNLWIDHLKDLLSVKDVTIFNDNTQFWSCQKKRITINNYPVIITTSLMSFEYDHNLSEFTILRLKIQNEYRSIFDKLSFVFEHVCDKKLSFVNCETNGIIHVISFKNTPIFSINGKNEFIKISYDDLMNYSRAEFIFEPCFVEVINANIAELKYSIVQICVRACDKKKSIVYERK